jgi:hypothetical protein
MIWRVEIYSYEIEDQIILCDVEAEHEDQAIRKAWMGLRFQPFLKHHARHQNLINKVFVKEEDEDDQPWFLMAAKIDKIEYPITEYEPGEEPRNIFQLPYHQMPNRIGCPPGLGRPTGHIQLGFTVAEVTTPDWDENGVSQYFDGNRVDYNYTSGTTGANTTMQIIET